MAVKITLSVFTPLNINIILLRKKKRIQTRGKKTVCWNFAVLRAAVFEPETLEFPAYIYHYT